MTVPILCILLFIALTGFFVAAEIAVVKVRLSQLEPKIQAGSSAALLAKKIIDHIDLYLVATQLGKVLSLATMFVSSLCLWQRLCAAGADCILAAVLLGLALCLLALVFAFLLPKTLGTQKAETISLLFSYPLRFFYLLTCPLLWIINGFAALILRIFGLQQVSEQETYTQEELKFLIEQAKEQVADSPEMREEENTKFNIIKNAFEFSERTVRQVMVPRTQMLAIDLNDYNKREIEHVIDEGFSRIPCYEDSVDNIVGLVHLKDILKELRRNDTVDIKSILRPTSFVPESKRIGLLLSEFQRKHQQMAMVINEYGGVEGIVTMEDILEELVGEIQDESDNEIPFVQQAGEGVYHILATASVNDINDLLPHAIDEDKLYDTLAGYLFDKFGRIPSLKESIDADNYRFTILKRNKTTILLVEAKDLEVKEDTNISENK